MNILITGVGGFFGRHLYARLKAHPLEGQKKILGIGRTLPSAPGIRAAIEKAELGFLHFDLAESQFKDLVDWMCENQITRVYHLAGSWARGTPIDFYRMNVLGTARLLEAVQTVAERIKIQPRVLLVGSSAEYGNQVDRSRGILETDPLSPLTPYGVSKLAEYWVGKEFFSRTGLPVIQARPFNTIGPGLPEVFFSSRVARQIVRCEKDPKVYGNKIEVRHLSATRDFVDIRDVVRGLVLAMEKGRPGEVYNLCSSRSTTLQQALDILVSKSKARLEIESANTPRAANDVEYQQGSYQKILDHTGWSPEVTLERSLEDMLLDWREKEG